MTDVQTLQNTAVTNMESDINHSGRSSAFPLLGGGIMLFIVVAVVLDLVLKAFALWKAGRNNQSWWFIALLILSSMGLIPVLYLAFFQKDKNNVVLVSKTIKSTKSK